MADIRSKTQRSKLEARREPHWYQLRTGCHVGYRKAQEGGGTWVAKWRDAATGKREHEALGAFPEGKPDPFEHARVAAEAFFKRMEQGVIAGPYTVEDACKAYIEACKSKSAAHKAALVFARLVYGDKIATTDVAKLRREDLQAWRKRVEAIPTTVGGPKGPLKGTPRAASTVNRDIAPLRAALNLALEDGRVSSVIAWARALKPAENATRRRTIYLDRADRAKLVAAAQADLKPLLQALCLLPMRPGAIAAIRARDFNPKTRSLLIGKDKAGADRYVTLPAQAAALFAGLARGKLPLALLFTRADGKPWNSHDWKRPVKDAVLAAGLPAGAVAYTLRHSTITDLVVGGLDLLTVAQISGTSVAMIEAHYGALQQDRAEAALARLAGV